MSRVPSWTTSTYSRTDDWATSALFNDFLAAIWERLRAIGVAFGTTTPYGDPPALRLYDGGSPDVKASDVQSAWIGSGFDWDAGETEHVMGARTVANMQ